MVSFEKEEKGLLGYGLHAADFTRPAVLCF
jgi:hypothetical protein